MSVCASGRHAGFKPGFESSAVGKELYSKLVQVCPSLHPTSHVPFLCPHSPEPPDVPPPEESPPQYTPPLGYGSAPPTAYGYHPAPPYSHFPKPLPQGHPLPPPYEYHPANVATASVSQTL